MLAYGRALTCRRQYLLAYFGEAAPPHCGRCDVCLGRHRPAVVTAEDEGLLRQLLAEVRDAVPRARWLAEHRLPAHRVHGFADWLLYEGLLTVDDPLAQTLRLTERGARFAAEG